MRSIDRLILKAQRLSVKQSLFLFIAFIDKNTEKYETKCQLWDGVPGGEFRTLENKHESLEEARTYIDMMTSKYSHRKKKPVVLEFVPASSVIGNEGQRIDGRS